MRSVSITVFLLFIALPAPAITLANDVVIITNEGVPTQTLSRDDIKQIFLGKKTTWDNGEKIIFAVQDRTEASDLFLKKYILKSAYQFDIYWKKQVFTGKGRTPRSFSSDQELVQFVSQTHGAIGYVSSGVDIGKTKNILVR